jgi:hypothetical protein
MSLLVRSARYGVNYAIGSVDNRGSIRDAASILDVSVLRFIIVPLLQRRINKSWGIFARSAKFMPK